MNTGFRKLIFAIVSGLVTAIGGTAISHASDRGTARDPSWKSAISGSLPNSQTVADLSKDDIREAQLELRRFGLYNGSLDGVIGPQTKGALMRFQKENRLEQTATLDPLTIVAMFGNLGTGQSSGAPHEGSQGTGE
jgi:peptidoglycan hydrolase-like protein with peptidoglycan-binding domain